MLNFLSDFKPMWILLNKKFPCSGIIFFKFINGVLLEILAKNIIILFILWDRLLNSTNVVHYWLDLLRKHYKSVISNNDLYCISQNILLLFEGDFNVFIEDLQDICVITRNKIQHYSSLCFITHNRLVDWIGASFHGSMI